MIDHTTKVIFKKELASYFSNPLGYVFLIIFLFSIGHFTFESGRGSFFMLRQADLSSFFQYMPLLFVFFIPAVSMRLWAEERRSGTVELLLTMPTTVQRAVTGKFLAAWAFLGLAIILTFPMAITVGYLGSPDWAVIFCGYLGSFLLAGAFLSIGLFFSALTKNQVISFILSILVCYIIMMAGSPPILELITTILPNYFGDLFESLSVLTHFESMSKGILRLSDIWYFTIMILGWGYASVALLNENKAS